METVNVRNLEQIQEEDPRRRTLRLGVFVLASLGGAALIVAGVSTMQRASAPAVSTHDPLATLVAEARGKAAPASEQLSPRDLAFSELTSDQGAPTTALVAVQDGAGALVPSQQVQAPAPLDTPAATEKLPVVPLPAGTLLAATPLTTQPRDSLTALAVKTGEVSPSAELAQPGSAGGYQLQVASFKAIEDADHFVDELRRRGHKAYRQAAYVADRGLWHRVRIGPFQNKYSATKYQSEFEAKEKMNSFLVDPDKVERQRQVRAAKAEEREQAAERQHRKTGE